MKRTTISLPDELAQALEREAAGAARPSRRSSAAQLWSSSV